MIYADSWEEHLSRMQLVRLPGCGSTSLSIWLNVSKVVGQGEVHSVRAKVVAIDAFPPPTTKKELMRFLGMIGYYRGF